MGWIELRRNVECGVLFMSLVGVVHNWLMSGYAKYLKRKMHCKGTILPNGFIEIESGECIHVGENFQPRKGVSLCAMKNRRHNYNTEIRIGDNVFLNYRTCIWATDRITIGNNVMVGPDVFITDNSHGRNDTFEELNIPPKLREHFSKGPIVIEDNVWLGAKTCVLGGVTIGKGSIIGATSVVTKDIPPYSIAAGNPAKVVKTFTPPVEGNLQYKINPYKVGE